MKLRAVHGLGNSGRTICEQPIDKNRLVKMSYLSTALLRSLFIKPEGKLQSIRPGIYTSCDGNTVTVNQ